MSGSGLLADSRSNAGKGRCRDAVQDWLDAGTRRGARPAADQRNLHAVAVDASWQVKRWPSPDGGRESEQPSIWSERTVRVVRERVDAAIRIEPYLRYVTTIHARLVQDGRGTVSVSLAKRRRTHIRNEDAT